MKILIDIGHPAHVHFYVNPIKIWRDSGHQVVITSRHKEVAVDLLDALRIKHQPLTTMNSGGLLGMAKELWQRDWKLLQVVRREKPDILTGIGGIFAAHVGFLTRRPSIVFYDTENAQLSNLITYPFASLVAVPQCYKAWLPPWHLRYPGYHELSYLHPNRFKADRQKAVALGLDPLTKNYLIRTVSWQASHDINEKKWSSELLARIVELLKKSGKVFISAEGGLPHDLREYAYVGPPEQIHHLMGNVDLFVGESATMASECAVMGVPAIYLAATSRGYTDEQDVRYALVSNLHDFDWQLISTTIERILMVDSCVWKKRQQQLLSEKIYVDNFVAKLVMEYPASVQFFKNKFSQEPA